MKIKQGTELYWYFKFFKLFNFERLHLQLYCKMFEIDKNELDWKLDYYENKRIIERRSWYR